MVFNIILIAVSWIIYYFIERKNLFKTWLLPWKKRLAELTKGFMLTAILCVLAQLGFAVTNDMEYSVSETWTVEKLLSSMVYDLNSVLFEELVFRGIALYLLIKFFSLRTSICISAIAFGVYHWFTNGVLGNPLAMVLVFLVTGFMGYAFAVAFDRTRSILLPFGLHIGWNLINHTIFSNGPKGEMILAHSQEMEPSIFGFVAYLLVAVVVLIAVRSKFFVSNVAVNRQKG
ncbi:MAG: type II CAAX endopeptidase family protein [Leeuwenhoekiella sp.]